MHQPMKQLPERAISEEEAREILRDAEYCVVATVDDDGHPYATPLSYALDKDTLLIHTGSAGGQKTEDWERDPRVCVTAAMDMEPVFVEENGEPGFFTTRFASVIATGTVRRVTEMAEIRRALALLCLKYAPEYKDEIGGAIDRELSDTAVWAVDSTISPAKRDVAYPTARERSRITSLAPPRLRALRARGSERLRMIAA